MLGVHAVESGKISHIAEETGGLDNSVDRASRSFKHGLQILTYLLGLLLDGRDLDA